MHAQCTSINGLQVKYPVKGLTSHIFYLSVIFFIIFSRIVMNFSPMVFIYSIVRFRSSHPVSKHLWVMGTSQISECILFIFKDRLKVFYYFQEIRQCLCSS